MPGHSEIPLEHLLRHLSTAHSYEEFQRLPEQSYSVEDRPVRLVLASSHWKEKNTASRPLAHVSSTSVGFICLKNNFKASCHWCHPITLKIRNKQCACNRRLITPLALLFRKIDSKQNDQGTVPLVNLADSVVIWREEIAREASESTPHRPHRAELK